MVSSVENTGGFTLNFGPQHPAAHGVLRLVVNLNGEVIHNCDPHIGLLHRGTEKLIEYRSIAQSLPYFDRLDYVSMMSQEHGFSRAIEGILDSPISIGVLLLRMLFLELTRILNHLLALTTHALDVGAMTPFLWAFEEREKIMEFYERASGARMHSNFIRPGGNYIEISRYLLSDIVYFAVNFMRKLQDIVGILDGSRIWRQRLSNIGIVSFDEALKWGFSGVMLRSGGLNWDLRKILGYDAYNLFSFNTYVGAIGDCYDRYLIRANEMFTSAELIFSCATFLAGNSKILNLPTSCYIDFPDNKVVFPNRSSMKNSMESLITHFKLFSEGISLEDVFFYAAVEAPKGELGVFVEFNDGPRPVRCKIRSPGYYHLQALDWMARDHLIADLVAIIGTQDIVFGEVDR